MKLQRLAWEHVMLQIKLANRGNMDRAIAENSLDGWFARAEADLMRGQANGQTATQPKI